MNDDVIEPKATIPYQGGIGYTLVDDTYLFTNSAVQPFRVIRNPEEARVISPWPQQETTSDSHLYEYAIILLVGYLLGFLMHMFVSWMRTRERT